MSDTLPLDHQYVLDEDISRVFTNIVALVRYWRGCFGGSPDATQAGFSEQGALSTRPVNGTHPLSSVFIGGQYFYVLHDANTSQNDSQPLIKADERRFGGRNHEVRCPANSWTLY